MNGPIIKDALYYGFWALALLAGASGIVAVIALLWQIDRKLQVLIDFVMK